MHYPNDENVYSLTDQFLDGKDFLIKPVLQPGQTTVDVYFPQGEWVHLWNNQIYTNADSHQKTIISAPLGQPAVFYLRDSAMAKSVRETMKYENLIKIDE